MGKRGHKISEYMKLNKKKKKKKTEWNNFTIIPNDPYRPATTAMKGYSKVPSRVRPRNWSLDKDIHKQQGG